jgi:hypothetical protein
MPFEGLITCQSKRMYFRRAWKLTQATHSSHARMTFWLDVKHSSSGTQN